VHFLPKKPSNVYYSPFLDAGIDKVKSCCYELDSPGEECPSPRPIKMMVVTSQDKDTLQTDAVSGTDAVAWPHLKWRCCTNNFTARGASYDIEYLHCHSKPGAQFWRISSPNSFKYDPDWDKQDPDWDYEY